jgi:hypothetical protein
MGARRGRAGLQPDQTRAPQPVLHTFWVEQAVGAGHRVQGYAQRQSGAADAIGVHTLSLRESQECFAKFAQAVPPSSPGAGTKPALNWTAPPLSCRASGARSAGVTATMRSLLESRRYTTGQRADRPGQSLSRFATDAYMPWQLIPTTEIAGWAHDLISCLPGSAQGVRIGSLNPFVHSRGQVKAVSRTDRAGTRGFVDVTKRHDRLLDGERGATSKVKCQREKLAQECTATRLRCSSGASNVTPSLREFAAFKDRLARVGCRVRGAVGTGKGGFKIPFAARRHTDGLHNQVAAAQWRGRLGCGQRDAGRGCVYRQLPGLCRTGLPSRVDTADRIASNGACNEQWRGRQLPLHVDRRTLAKRRVFTLSGAMR